MQINEGEQAQKLGSLPLEDENRGIGWFGRNTLHFGLVDSQVFIILYVCRKASSCIVSSNSSPTLWVNKLSVMG